MTQVVTLKIQVLPTAEEKAILDRTMGAYLDACNFVSGYIFESRDLVQASVHDRVYYEVRARFGLRSQMASSVIKAVIAAYRTILSNKKPWMLVRFRHGFYDLVFGHDYGLKGDLFSVNTLDGRLKLRFKSQYFGRFLVPGARLGTAKLVSRKGKYYIYAPVELDLPEAPPIRNVCGVDLGQNFLAASYDSRDRARFYPGREAKRRRLHFRSLRKELQAVGSRSAKRRLAAVSGRENRWMSDVNHRVSKALVRDNGPGTLFVLEDLDGIREALVKRKGPGNRYLSMSWAYGDLAAKLEYKARMDGSSVVYVNPAYTSQTCPKCGHREPGNRDKGTHRFQCRACGYRSNDDRVAAMNLQRAGIQYREAVVPE